MQLSERGNARMVDVYGGLLLKNLASQDEYYELQCRLLEKRYIQGIQLRVDPIALMPELKGVDLQRILSRWKAGLFIHFGAESVGVDLGETLDEEGVFEKHGNGQSWMRWNSETITLGIQVARTAGIPYPAGVLHPGYGRSSEDMQARMRIIRSLQGFDQGKTFAALEIVPPLVLDTEGKMTHWGFGGTPDDMARLLQELGQEWKCFFDFTHLFVLVNQAQYFPDHPLLAPWQKLEQTLERYMRLPHMDICHFSGLPPELMDSHSYPLGGSLPPKAIKDGLKQMEVVCLEIRFHRMDLETAEREIDWFREKYLS